MINIKRDLNTFIKLRIEFGLIYQAIGTAISIFTPAGILKTRGSEEADLPWTACAFSSERLTPIGAEDVGTIGTLKTYGPVIDLPWMPEIY